MTTELLRQTQTLLQLDASGVAHLIIDQQGQPFNTVGATLHRELAQIRAALTQTQGVRALVISSGKPDFVVGADIAEFGDLFAKDEAGIIATNAPLNAGFSAIEDLPFPVVAAVGGMALGGGLELALLADARILSQKALLGLPEVKLGLIPGLGGTVRLPRLAGVEAALDWISSGTPVPAATALSQGVAAEVTAPEDLLPRATALALALADNPKDWQAARARKTGPLSEVVDFAALRAKIAKRAGKNQPAALLAVDLLEKASALPRDSALAAEGAAFALVARTQAADALVGTFFAERRVKKIAAKAAEGATRPISVLVLGAGIMGGGIAWACARAGIKVRIKDIADAALQKAESEIARLLKRETERGRLSPQKADALRALITLQLDETGFDEVDLVIEAVVEKLEVKRAVLAELEPKLNPKAVIATNTSSLRVRDIATALQDPSRLVGMHFFNPVPVMPLVEVIRAPATRPEAVALATRTVLDLRKTPIVVADCPGFLVNRILTAYINAFTRLVGEGVDFRAIDAAIEGWGWPMGPAYLEDVVGMDTGAHVIEVISAGYPQRMSGASPNVIGEMARLGRLGQKSGEGFYAYAPDASGRLSKQHSDSADQVIAAFTKGASLSLSPQDIVERMMLPTLVEAIAALEEMAVGTPEELDQALLLGIGFPAYAGGALRYADWLGLPHLLARCEALAAKFGPAYAAPQLLRDKVAAGQNFYG